MRHFFSDMTRPPKSSFLVLHRHQNEKRMKTGMYWVYITEDSESGITIGFSTEMDKTLFELSMRGISLSYHCSEVPYFLWGMLDMR